LLLRFCLDDDGTTTPLFFLTTVVMFGALECDFNDQSLGRCCNLLLDVAFLLIVVVIDVVVKDNDEDDDVSQSEARDNNIDLPIKIQYKTTRTATIHLIFMPIFAADIFISCCCGFSCPSSVCRYRINKINMTIKRNV
jgi:hypothetical protein